MEHVQASLKRFNCGGTISRRSAPDQGYQAPISRILVREHLETVFLKQKKNIFKPSVDDKYRQQITADDSQRKLMTDKKIDESQIIDVSRWQIKKIDYSR